MDREPAVAIRFAGTVTIRLDGITEEGVRFVPPQSTMVAWQKFAPAIVTTRAPPPAGTDGGFNPLIAGPAGAKTVKAAAADEPALHTATLGLTTRTDAVLGLVSSGAGTVTTRLDGLTEDGIRFVPPQSTTEAEQKFAPEIVTAIAPLPAGADEGFNPLIEGGVEGAATENVAAPEVPGLQPEALGLTTRTNRTPAVASRVDGTVTTRLVGVTEEGVRFVPNQSTIVAEQKFAPEIVTAMAALPAGADEGLKPLIEGGPEGGVTVNVTAPEVPGLQPETFGLTTRTDCGPA
jgi:hypothetical protein